jgi:hypothetical protein
MEAEKTTTKAYGALLALSGLFALAAVATLLPWPAASWRNILGYKSLCTFTPIGTAICALMAAITCTARARLAGPRRGERRPWTAPIAAALALAIIIGLSIPPYAKAKVDARSGATVSASTP